MKKNILIGTDNAGKRVDKFLKEEVFFNLEISRGEITENIKKGKVLVNDKEVKPSYVLRKDDQIELDFDPEKKQEIVPNLNLEIPIIHEDENIIVINKPAGIRVHMDSQEMKNTLVNFLVARYPGIEKIHDESRDAWMRPGIVHRLDMDTSGIIVIARNEKTFLELKRQFQSKEVEKKYAAIVYGKLDEKEGVIEKSLARASTYKKQVIATRKTKTKVREAITHYKVIQELGDYTLLEVSPKTGRMHQIRVHLASIGHPIVGDERYLLKDMKEKEFRRNGRHLLHAKSIRFDLFGQSYFFETELPLDFLAFLDETQIKR